MILGHVSTDMYDLIFWHVGSLFTVLYGEGQGAGKGSCCDRYGRWRVCGCAPRSCGEGRKRGAGSWGDPSAIASRRLAGSDVSPVSRTRRLKPPKPGHGAVAIEGGHNRRRAARATARRGGVGPQLARRPPRASLDSRRLAAPVVEAHIELHVGRAGLRGAAAPHAAVAVHTCKPGGASWSHVRSRVVTPRFEHVVNTPSCRQARDSAPPRRQGRTRTHTGRNILRRRRRQTKTAPYARSRRRQ